MTDQTPTSKTLTLAQLGQMLKFNMAGSTGYSMADKGSPYISKRPAGKITSMVYATLLATGLSTAMIAGAPSLGHAEPANHQMDGLTAEQERFLEVQKGLRDMILYRFDLGMNNELLREDEAKLYEMMSREEFTPQDIAVIEEIGSYLVVLGRDKLKNETGSNTPSL